MANKSQPLKALNGALSLNGAIDTLDLAKDTASIKSVGDAFGSCSIVLTTIRVCFSGIGLLIIDLYIQDSMAKEADCVELGLTCAEVCQALERGINGRRQGHLNQLVLEAIVRLNTWVEWGIRAPDRRLTNFSQS